MTRFICFLLGFALSLGCGSLFLMQYRPQFPNLDGLVSTVVFERSSDITIDTQMTRVIELFDATKAKLTESVREWDGIDLGQYLDADRRENAKFVELIRNEQNKVYAEISALALKHGHAVASVSYEKDFGWTIELESGEQVVLGDEDVGTRLYRALSMIDALPVVAEGVRKHIDARYSNGIAFVPKTEQLVALE